MLKNVRGLVVFVWGWAFNIFLSDESLVTTVRGALLFD